VSNFLRYAVGLVPFYALATGPGAWRGPRYGRRSYGPKFDRVWYGNGILQTYGRTEQPETPTERRAARRKVRRRYR